MNIFGEPGPDPELDGEMPRDVVLDDVSNMRQGRRRQDEAEESPPPYGYSGPQQCQTQVGNCCHVAPFMLFPNVASSPYRPAFIASLDLNPANVCVCMFMCTDSDPRAEPVLTKFASESNPA